MNPLYGLVICGGESSRMGSDKSLLEYRGKPQRDHVYEMLEPFCEKVFISCNKNQVGTMGHFPAIVDAEPYEGIGPMAALLSAFLQHPHADFLCLACDYPFLDSKDIAHLLKARDSKHSAFTFFNPQSGFAEPLLGIYPADIYPSLLDEFKHGNYSLQQFLKKSSVKQVIPTFPENIFSADIPAAYRAAVQKLKRKTI
jgi:molybdopterin-guanine dinucleotide biosynthesis protein A